MKRWIVQHEGNTIEVVNQPVVMRLLVNGKTQDVVWGFITLNSEHMTGRYVVDGTVKHIKAVVGAKWATMQCAIFVDDQLILDSTGSL